MAAGDPSSPGPPHLESVLSDLTRLRRFPGPPAEFWPTLVADLGRLAGAARGVLLLAGAAPTDGLRKLGEWSANGHAEPAAFSRCLPALVAECVRQAQGRQTLENGRVPGTKNFAVGVNLRFAAGATPCVAAFLLLDHDEGRANEALVRLQLAADVPLSYQTNQATAQAQHDVQKFAVVLDVLALVNAEQRFLAATLALCNGVAERFQCERVSLGWLEQGFVRLKTISRTERFDRQTAAVRALEVTMEEALDQDEEVLWPARPEAGVVTRDHEKYAREQGVAHLVSLPLRAGAEPVAVLTCERLRDGFSPLEVDQLRLAADTVARRLVDLHRFDRWFGARWVHSLRGTAATLVGPKHTWAKVGSVLGALALIALCLPVYPYRVEGNFILRSDDVAYLTAPFDGYIQSVPARPGDRVPEAGVLLRLNTDQLALEEAAAIADETRYQREADKARAARALAEMRIAQAQAEQARARLELVRYRLGQAGIRAPFGGVVIEGDLRERVGAPVRQGDELFKLARPESLYPEAEINERDVHEILGKSTGQIAFVARPKLKFPIQVVRLEPAAVPKEKENVFRVRCRFVGPAEPWWRPGMSGVCKIAVERRTLVWILTHRTVDFLRLLLWW